MLYFEGERHHSHRVVRAVKNRFGAASELGVFEMTASGLRPVPNPSKMFLAERPVNAPGSAVLCSVEGSRPILVEVQALVSSSTYGNARRMASGIDQQRLTLLLAVLEKRAGLNLIGDEVFVMFGGFVLGLYQGFQMPELWQVGLLLLSATLLSGGYLLIVIAMRLGELSATAPFRYFNILITIVIGMVIFSEYPDGLAYIGMVLVIIAGLYAAHRESKVRGTKLIHETYNEYND